jgi:hypothetical protein
MTEYEKGYTDGKKNGYEMASDFFKKRIEAYQKVWNIGFFVVIIFLIFYIFGR